MLKIRVMWHVHGISNSTIMILCSPHFLWARYKHEFEGFRTSLLAKITRDLNKYIASNYTAAYDSYRGYRSHKRRKKLAIY